MNDPDIDTYLDRAEVCWVTALSRASVGDLGSISGCPDWTSGELINHLIGGGLRYAKLLAQKPPEEVEATRGQNHLGEDLLESFWTHEREFRRIAGECDLDAQVPHRIGPLPGHQLLRMRILELALHAADLSVGTGDEWPIDDQLAEYMCIELGELIGQLGAVGGYAPAQPSTRTHENTQASHAERVLNISGRTGSVSAVLPPRSSGR